MTQFVMTRARYKILCALVDCARTMSDLQDTLEAEDQSNLAQQAIALRNAGLIEADGHRATGKRGPKPILYRVTDRGAAAIQSARVALAFQSAIILELSVLEVAA